MLRAFLDEWDKGFFTYEERPEGYELPVVQGQLPKEIRGTYYRFAGLSVLDLLRPCFSHASFL